MAGCGIWKSGVRSWSLQIASGPRFQWEGRALSRPIFFLNSRQKDRISRTARRPSLPFQLIAGLPPVSLGDRRSGPRGLEQRPYRYFPIPFRIRDNLLARAGPRTGSLPPTPLLLFANSCLTASRTGALPPRDDSQVRDSKDARESPSQLDGH
jgi:hypothetical protein